MMTNSSLLLLPYFWVLLGMGMMNSAWVAMGGYHFSMVVYLGISGKRHDVLDIITKDSKTRGSYLKFAPFLAVGIAVPLILLWSVVGLDKISVLLLEQGVRPFWPLALYYPVVNPILEELYWREQVNKKLQHKILGDVFFGGYHALVLVHFVEGWFAVVCAVSLVGVAWFWRRISKTTGSLYVATASHFAANVGIVLSVAFMD